MSISSSTSPADSPFSADQPPPPPSPPTALPPLVVTPRIALAPVISPPAPPLDPLPSPLPQLPSPSASPPAEAPLAADPPLAASTPPAQDVTPLSPPSPVLLPPVAAATPPSATPIPVTSPPAPEMVPAAPDTSSLSPPAPPVESKSPPTKPSRKHRSPRKIPSTPSTPAKPQAQPLPTLLSPSPASPPTAIPSFENAPPTSFGPIFPELPLAPPVSLASPPVAPELVTGSLPVTINGGQSQPVGGQRTTEEFHVATGLIVGFAIAGGLFLAILVLSCFICRRRKKQSCSDEKDYYGSQPSGIKVVKNGYHDVLSNHNAASTKPHLIEMRPPKSSAPAALTSYSPGPVGSPGQAILPSSLSMSIGVFTYDELTEATENFSSSNLLGEGGFGYVHKGVLTGGKEIAVKQLKIGSHQGEREFQAELDTISRVHHKHLVTLLGYCITGEARFLVYEFVPNRTLEFHLHGIGQPVMDWATRLKIAVGSAKGLAYLHEDCSPTIIHRDIKAANILLDFKFEAKVSDFGLAKFFSDTNSHVTHISTRVVGTFGYLAPEYASSGKLTEKSDVYSYGVMLLELITGRPPISRSDTFMNEGLVDWARPLLNQAIRTGYLDDIVDPRLQKNYDSNEMVNLIECAAASVRHSAWLRPRMSQIVRALEENEPLTDHEEGYTPGHSKLYSSLDMKKLTMALASQDCESSRLSDNTSEYGLYPSCSSSEAHMAR